MSEIDKTIEELEQEVLAELEEAKQPKDGAGAPEKGDKVDGERQDLGGAKPEAKAEKGADEDRKEKDIAAKNKAKPVSGDAQQKGAKSEPKVKQGSSDEATPGESQKLAAGDYMEAEEGQEDLSEAPKTKADHLAVFEKMKASQVKEMLAAYQKGLKEQEL